MLYCQCYQAKFYGKGERIMVYAFLADGFEEVEALMVVDILRRAGIETVTVSVSDNYEVKSSHNIVVRADDLIKDVDFDKAELIFLPGGIPGTPNLAACETLVANIKEFNNKGKRLAAICAAPSILGELGILEGKVVSCYPGYEDSLKGATYKREKVITDGNITTARGLGAAIDMGLELVTILKSKEEADSIAEKIQLV